MKTVFTQAGEFSYLAELHQLAAQPGKYHLAIQTTFGGAKDPEGLRTLFQVTTHASGLVVLRDLINSELAQSSP